MADKRPPYVVAEVEVTDPAALQCIPLRQRAASTRLFIVEGEIAIARESGRPA